MPTLVGGTGAVQTSTVSYSLIDLTSNQVLYWPTSYMDTSDLVTLWMNVTNVGAGFTLQIAPANQVSVGQNFIIYNIGAHDFTLLDATGANIGVISVGIAYNYVLTDNSTIAGLWTRITYGAGSSSADATALAGYGLETTNILNKLNVYMPVTTWAGASFVTDATMQAGVIAYTGVPGTTVALPLHATIPSGFPITISNDGASPCVVTADAPILGITVINAGNSSLFVWDGPNVTWRTIASDLASVVPISLGGTGQTTKAAAFTALAPAAAAGALMTYTTADHWNDPLEASIVTGSPLLSVTGGLPAWTGLSILNIVNLNFTTAIPNLTNVTMEAIAGFTVTINPTFVNSKVLIMVTINISANDTGTGGLLQLRRDEATINTAPDFITCGFTPTDVCIPYTFFFLDSPATTAATVYSLYALTNDVTKQYSINQDLSAGNGASSNMMAIEIGGVP